MIFDCRMIAAQRKSSKSIEVAHASLIDAGFTPIVHSEPGTTKVGHDLFFCVNDKKLGNYWNWINAARTAVEFAKDTADGILITEDDALHSRNIRPFIEHIMWPSARCGAIALYCPNVPYYRKPTARIFQSDRPNHVGALSMLFRPQCLREILADEEAVNSWRGSWDQKHRDLPPHEIKAVDAWIGETMLKHNWNIWVCSRSLVQHYHPPEAPDNSTLNHGQATRARSAYQWIGMNGDPWKTYGISRPVSS